MLNPDDTVIGAGPAATATASHLARAGMGVLVLDRSTFPRPKLCGEFLSPEALAPLARLGILERVLATGAPADPGPAPARRGHATGDRALCHPDPPPVARARPLPGGRDAAVTTVEHRPLTLPWTAHMGWLGDLWWTLEDSPFLRWGTARRSAALRVIGALAWAAVACAYAAVIALRTLPLEGHVGREVSSLSFWVFYAVHYFFTLVPPGLMGSTLTAEVERDTAIGLCLTPYPRVRMLVQLAWTRGRTLVRPFALLLPLAIFAPVLFTPEAQHALRHAAPKDVSWIDAVPVPLGLAIGGFLLYVWLAAGFFFAMACGVLASAWVRTTGAAVAIAYALALGVPCILSGGISTLLCFGMAGVAGASGSGGPSVLLLVTGGLGALLLYLAVYVALPILFLRRAALGLDRILCSPL